MGLIAIAFLEVPASFLRVLAPFTEAGARERDGGLWRTSHRNLPLQRSVSTLGRKAICQYLPRVMNGFGSLCSGFPIGIVEDRIGHSTCWRDFHPECLPFGYVSKKTVLEPPHGFRPSLGLLLAFSWVSLQKHVAPEPRKRPAATRRPGLLSGSQLALGAGGADQCAGRQTRAALGFFEPTSALVRSAWILGLQLCFCQLMKWFSVLNH